MTAGGRDSGANRLASGVGVTLVGLMDCSGEERKFGGEFPRACGCGMVPPVMVTGLFGCVAVEGRIVKVSPLARRTENVPLRRGGSACVCEVEGTEALGGTGGVVTNGVPRFPAVSSRLGKDDPHRPVLRETDSASAPRGTGLDPRLRPGVNSELLRTRSGDGAATGCALRSASVRVGDGVRVREATRTSSCRVDVLRLARISGTRADCFGKRGR